MRIEIENTSSPGASFTENTNNVLLKINDWIKEHNNYVLPFREFRKKLQQEKGINDNNARNIYPLLKNCGLIQYEIHEDLLVNDFFTKTGQAYVTALETKRLLITDDNYTEEKKRIASQKIDTIISEIIKSSLALLFKNKELNYVEPLKDFASFLLTYKKINKTEFAYLVFLKKNNTSVDAIKSAQQVIKDYRSGKLLIDVDVIVRNDVKIREKTKTDHRKEDLSFLTSYTYFSSLLQQAGFIKKDDGYIVLKEETRDDLKRLLEV